MTEILYKVMGLKKFFPIKGGLLSRIISQVHAVDNVTFEIRKGETLGLVGESGCGKTTIGRCMLLLTRPNDGKLIFYDNDLLSLSKREIQKKRIKMSMIFQDPYSSLNPRMTVADIIGEPIEIHNIAKGHEKENIVRDLLKTVGLASHHIYRYPHEFSGGQKQRIAIARALATTPDLVVADEPVAALDMSVQASMLNLMRNLQKNEGLTYLFISHNLSVIKYICDRIMVMYVGKLVEIAEKNQLFSDPKHPYTKALLSAIPVPDPTVKVKRVILLGDVPTPIDPPSGCRFYQRCRYAMPICSKKEPELIDISDSHQVACHLMDKK